MSPGQADRSTPSGAVVARAVVAGDVVEDAGAPGAEAGPAARRPAMRGVLHEAGFFVSLVAGPLLVASAPDLRARELSGVYAASLILMLGTSALLHRRTWSIEHLRIMRKLDMAMIFVLIAGTYTAVVGITLRSWLAGVVLWVVWGVAAVGSVAALCFAGRGLRSPAERRPSKWVVLLPYLGVGWLAMSLMAALLHSLGAEGAALLLAGGVVYTAGAVVYAARAPDPWPETFGYHEVFHALVLLGAGCHFALVALVVLPHA